MKKLFFPTVLTICLFISTASRAQSIILLADKVQGSSVLGKGAIDVISMGTSVGCQDCAVAPVNTAGSGASIFGRVYPGKIVFNMQNEAAVNTLRNVLLSGSYGRSGSFGDAYFVFAKPGEPAGGKSNNYYYIKLSNYTVLEINEASDKDNHSVQVSLGFSALTWTTKSASGVPVSYSWDFSKSTTIQGTAIPNGY